MPEQVTIVCRERGVDCDWEVLDSDEDEALASAEAHARRRHGAEPSRAQLRPGLRPARKGVGGI